MKNTNDMNIVYKPANDSYTGLPANADLSGTRQLMALTKKGLKNNDGDAVKVFHLVAYLASCRGYDYVILSKHRTNSGRHEAVLFDVRSVNIGRRLVAVGYRAPIRSIDTTKGALCQGDVFTAPETLPQHYDDLPIHPSMVQEEKPAPSPIELLEQHMSQTETVSKIDMAAPAAKRVNKLPNELKIEFLLCLADSLVDMAAKIEKETT
jgi:hypothetical protein